MAGGSRRKNKRLLRQMGEEKEVLERMMATCRARGIRVDFAWQVPDIFEMALDGQLQAGAPHQIGTSAGGLALPLHQPQAPSHNSPVDALRALSQAKTGVPAPGRTKPPAQHRLQGLQPLPSPVFEEADEDVSIDDTLSNELFDEFGSAEDEETEQPDMAEMMRRVQVGQGQMMRRVAQNGVQYSRGMAGPAAGKKLVPHPSTSKKVVEARPTAPRAEDPIPDLGEGFGGFDFENEGEEQGGDDEGGAPASVDDGRVDKNGIPIANKRAMLERLTGRKVAPPKPSGIPNTLK